MIITTRFSIGDKVWLGTTRWANKSVVCKACGGDAKFCVGCKDGTTISVKCPRCSGFGVDNFYDFRPIVEELTIGSVRFDSHDKGEEESYMCCETGVGAGSIFTGCVLFATREEAEEAASKATEKARADHVALRGISLY